MTGHAPRRRWRLHCSLGSNSPSLSFPANAGVRTSIIAKGLIERLGKAVNAQLEIDMGGVGVNSVRGHGQKLRSAFLPTPLVHSPEDFEVGGRQTGARGRGLRVAQRGQRSFLDGARKEAGAGCRMPARSSARLSGRRTSAEAPPQSAEKPRVASHGSPSSTKRVAPSSDASRRISSNPHGPSGGCRAASRTCSPAPPDGGLLWRGVKSITGVTSLQAAPLDALLDGSGVCPPGGGTLEAIAAAAKLVQVWKRQRCAAASLATKPRTVSAW